MDRLHAMRVFVKAAEAGGFAEAARQLNMSPPAVTRAIAMLEETIGARLFTPTTRLVKVTETGERYFEDCRRILADIAEAEAAAAGRHANPSGTLTVTASVLFGEQYILPILLDYLDLHPAVQAQAIFVDRVVNLVEEGIDVAVRIGHLPDSSHAAARVGAVRRVICASPDYLARHGIPQVPGDLAKHRIIASTSAWTSLDWRFGADGRIAVKIEPRLRTLTNRAAIDAAVAGWGLTRILSYAIGDELIAGRLQTVLTGYEEEPMPIHVVHPEGRRASATVRTFVDLAVQRLRAHRVIN